MDKVFSPATFKTVETPVYEPGYVKIYPKSDGNFYKLASDGEKLIGSGGSGFDSLIPNQIATLTYDAYNRIIQKIENINGGGTFEARFGYNAEGPGTGKIDVAEVKDSRITTSDGWIRISYVYDEQGRLTGTTHTEISLWGITV